MIYEVGKTYKSATGEVLFVESIDPLKVYIHLLIGANGQDVRDENLYIEGAAENFQGFMTATGCEEYNDKELTC